MANCKVEEKIALYNYHSIVNNMFNGYELRRPWVIQCIPTSRVKPKVFASGGEVL